MFSVKNIFQSLQHISLFVITTLYYWYNKCKTRKVN